jgi:hypothetical protein
MTIPYYEIVSAIYFCVSPYFQELWDTTLAYFSFKTMKENEDFMKQYKFSDYRAIFAGMTYSYICLSKIRIFPYLNPSVSDTLSPSERSKPLTINQMKLLCKANGIDVVANIDRHNKGDAMRELAQLL